MTIEYKRILVCVYRAYGIRESSPEFSETSRSLRRVLMFAHEPNKEKLLKERPQIKLKYIVYASSSTFIYRFHTNQTSSVQNKHFPYVLHHLQVVQDIREILRLNNTGLNY